MKFFVLLAVISFFVAVYTAPQQAAAGEEADDVKSQADATADSDNDSQANASSDSGTGSIAKSGSKADNKGLANSAARAYSNSSANALSKADGKGKRVPKGGVPVTTATPIVKDTVVRANPGVPV